jgi:hypothetical protein
MGDSWAEEIGWKRDLFKRVFDEIGVRYTSKTAYVAAREKGEVFQGKAYAAYYDRKTNRTFFVRNHDLAEEMLALTGKKASKTTPRPLEHQIMANNTARTSSIPSQKGTYPEKKGREGGSLTQYSNTQKTQSLNSNKITYKNISSSKNSFGCSPTNKSSPTGEKEEEVLKMIEVWEKTIAPLDTWQKMGQGVKRLKQAFQRFFESSLDKWQGYCQKIASSKFLMGEGGSSFKAWILWAIKEETILRIGQGGFTFGDRATPERLEEKQAKEAHRQALQRRFEALSEEEKEGYVKAYVRHYQEINPALIQSILSSGFNTDFLKASFKTFVMSKWGLA